MGVFPPLLIASLALFLNNPLFLMRYDPTPATQLRKYTFIASLPTLFISSLPRLMVDVQLEQRGRMVGGSAGGFGLGARKALLL